MRILRKQRIINDNKIHILKADWTNYNGEITKLLERFDRSGVPLYVFYQDKNNSSYALLFYGTTNYAAKEAMDLLVEEDIKMDAIRILAFPFNQQVDDFLQKHEMVFIIEQNRDAQMKSLLVNELNISQEKLISVLNYDGIPITAEAIKNNVVATDVC